MTPQAMAAPGRAINPRQVLYANVDLSRFGLEVISLLDHQLSIEALLERGTGSGDSRLVM